MDSSISARSRGSSERVSTPARAMRRTSPLGTAHTSHRSCVTIRSGARLLEQLRVDGVERLAVRERVAHRAVDLGARDRRGVDARRRDDRNRGDLGRVVALVRTADQAAGEAERGDDLGGARDEGNDAHASSVEGTAPARAVIGSDDD